MAWSTITTDMVKTRLAGAELSALQTAALAAGQTDPLPEIIEQVVDEARGYIAAAGVVLEDGTKLPSKLVGSALAMIRYRLATRLPVKGMITEDRKEENSQAIRLLEAVAAGRFKVEEAATPSAEAISAPRPSVTGKTLTFRREDQDGI